jgi:hypothetical protein
MAFFIFTEEGKTMDDKPLIIEAKDGRSRVFDKKGNLVSIDGVPVENVTTAPEAPVKKEIKANAK